MTYTDVPSAVGTLRPAAAPRLALAAPQPGRRRALELLASRNGATEAIMLAHGFTVEQMVELINAGARNGKGRAHGRGLAQDRSRARADHGPGAAGAQR